MEVFSLVPFSDRTEYKNGERRTARRRNSEIWYTARKPGTAGDSHHPGPRHRQIRRKSLRRQGHGD